MKIKTRLLIIEDETSIRKVLIAGLKESFEVIEAASGREGLLALNNYGPELIILDLGLPDMEGREVVSKIREVSKVPIVILSARGQEQEKILVLDAGADDYVTKPFVMGELQARLRVAIRHSVQNSSGEKVAIYENGTLKIDYEFRTVFAAGREIKLTPTEYRLLCLLSQNAGKVVTHRQLLTTVWGAAYKNDTAYLRVYMGQLRQKLRDNPDRPKILITEPGIGYRLSYVE